MPDFPIRVKIDPRGADLGGRKVEDRLKRIENRADTMRKTMARAFQFAIFAGGIAVLRNLADTYTNLQNRIRTVTTSYQEQAAVTERLFNISNATRSSFEATTEVYARTALAVKEMGKSQEETLRFTESLNQAVILSGASAQEAQAGMIQLSQGLASGALRGDELRSVLEQLPAVADVIAKGLGVTRGELRQMGQEGKITADIVLDSFAEAREELAERFGRTVPTISQSFVVFRNKVLQAIGSLDEAVGASRILSQVIIGLANNMETLIRIVGALAIAFGVALAKKGIGAAISSMKALNLLIVSNPIGALATVIVGAVAALITFSDKIKLSTDGIVTLRDYGVAAFQVMRERLIPLLITIEQGFAAAIETVTGLLQGLGLTFGDILGFMRDFVNRQIGLFVGMGQAIAVVFRRLKDTITSFFTGGEIPASAGTFGSNVRDAFLEGFGRDFVGDFLGLLSPAFGEIGDRARQLAEERLRAQREAQAPVSLADVKTPERPENREAVRQILMDLETEAELLRLTNAEREIQNELIAIQEELQKSNIQLTAAEADVIEERLRGLQSLADQAALYEDINSRITEFQTTQSALNELYAQGRISLDQYNQALRDTQLGLDLDDLQTSLLDADMQITQQLRDQLEERQTIINEALEARLITEQEHLALSLEANKAYNDAILQNELSRQKMLLSSGAQTFGALADLISDFGGKQSKTYRALFAISKAFAIAESTIAIVQGIAKSASLGWPANIAAIAATIAQTAGLVSQIKSVTYAGGFQRGGSFKVQGQGGADSQMVAFKATPGEQVNIQTPAQQAAAAAPAGGSGVNFTAVNVVDPAIVEDFLTSPEGETVLVNSIGNNRESINATLQQ